MEVGSVIGHLREPRPVVIPFSLGHRLEDLDPDGPDLRLAGVVIPFSLGHRLEGALACLKAAIADHPVVIPFSLGHRLEARPPDLPGSIVVEIPDRDNPLPGTARWMRLSLWSCERV